ncbi:hypothetical protein [Psychroserpens sp. MEBiC05023]
MSLSFGYSARPEDVEDNDDYDYHEDSSKSNAWWQLPELNDYLISLRKNNRLEYSLNISIIMNSAIIVEGFLYETIKDHVGEMVWNKTISDRLNTEFNKRLDNSSWNELINHFQTVFDFGLNSLTEPENWKAIMILFSFRNMLTHSKPIMFSVKMINKKPVMRHLGNYEKVYQFLVEKKLINKIDFYESMETELINSKIADFFWNEAQTFINNVVKQSTDIQGLPVEQSLKIAFEYK